MRKNILAVFFLVFCPLLIAQQALNNDSVIKLTKAGLSDDLIVSTVNSQAGAYDTSTDGLICPQDGGGQRQSRRGRCRKSRSSRAFSRSSRSSSSPGCGRSGRPGIAA